MKNVLIGISGGVDSAVSLHLLKEKYNVIGLNFNFLSKEDNLSFDAKKVCEDANVKFISYDAYEMFKKEVMDNFVKSYKNGETPNPCVICNKKFKFNLMYEIAKKNNIEYIATGHYAKVEYSEKYKRYAIKNTYSKKDQSYFLYAINKDILPYVIFPLEDFKTKEETRKYAEKLNLFLKEKKDSQDVCFIPDKDYKKFIINNYNIKDNPGDIILKKDNIKLGTHSGLYKYTIGQRKGLNIGYKKPLYVIEFDIKNNILYVGDEEELYKKEIIIEDYNLQLIDSFEDGIEVMAKIRYNSNLAKARLYNKDNSILVIFEEAQKSPTKGQSCVFYLDDYLVGGGIIK